MASSSTNTLGKYEIIREIARSNDIVYEAVDPTINRRVALKELSIPPNVTGAQRRERIDRFLREGRAAGKLAHPNIVTVYEVGKENDRYFIAMEFLEGQTLRDILQTGGALSISDTVSYTLQLCSALSYAHRCGVIHRDIKPENVQILPGGHVKLTDFGIARLMEEPSITQDGQVFGTPSYMSPEQVAGKKLDARSDIFSVGVLLYEMVTGRKPFAGDTVVTITYNIMNMEPGAPPGAPPYIAGIIRRAMAKEPDARYSSIDDLAQDLREEKASVPFAFNGGSVPSPFGGATQGTPYGPPAPPAGTGGQGASIPDPFAAAGPPPIPMPPPPPAPPILSAETRNFLGIFLLIIGLTGMLFFAGWAVNIAYRSYVTAQTGGKAKAYYEQGLKAFESGNREAAIEQWRNAERVSPRSDYAALARDAIFRTLVQTARDQYLSLQYANQMDTAKRLIESRPDSPEGYYYAGLAYESQGDPKSAVEQYNQAVRYGGNDEYAIDARARRERLVSNAGAAPSQPAQPPPVPKPESNIPFEPAPPPRR